MCGDKKMSALVSRAEKLEYEERMEKGCWYCDRKNCMLTHKCDPLKDARHPERDPYRLGGVKRLMRGDSDEAR